MVIIGEHFKILMCISYWESRKVRGWFAVFFPLHNYACQLKADHYRGELKKMMARIS